MGANLFVCLFDYVSLSLSLALSPCLSLSLSFSLSVSLSVACAEMGDNLPAVDLGTGKTATAISCGNDFSCALLVSLLPSQERILNVFRICTWKSGLETVDLGMGKTATAVSCGNDFSCALLVSTLPSENRTP